MIVKEAYELVRRQIALSCAGVGRSPASVRLMAVTKGKSPKAISDLIACGHSDFGENYAQELLAKAKLLPSTVRWSFIGRLQGNKIAKIVASADEIHSLASLRHAALISEHAKRLEKTPYPVFIAVNAANEASKDGVASKEAVQFARELAACHPELSVQGIMAIPPRELARAGGSEAKRLYQDLRKLADQIGSSLLSLGMSSDYELAIACGSDIVRIGEALLGKRVLSSRPG